MPFKVWLQVRALQLLGVPLPALSGEMVLRLFTTPQRVPRPAWEAEIVKTGQSVTLKSGLHATSWGEIGQPTVWLVHGWQGRGSQLGHLVAPLIEKKFHVMALDGPAHGESPGKRTNVNEFAQFLLAAVKEYPGHVVAHSFGAAAAALALAACGQGGGPLHSAVFVAAPSDLHRVVGFFALRMQLSPRVKSEFERRLATWIRLRPEETDLARIGQKVSVPVLVAHDPSDSEVAFDNAERFIRYWPNARLLSLPRVGHYKILKSAAFIAGATEFLVATRIRLDTTEKSEEV